MKQILSTKWFLFSEKDFSLGKDMSEKNLKKLMTGIKVLGSLGNPSREIKHIAFDSRKIRKGDLFVAIPGQKYDGKSFIKEAIDKGAVAILTQSPIKVLSSIITKMTSRLCA